MNLDLFRRIDGALVVVPTRFAHALPSVAAAPMRYVRTVDIGLEMLGDALVLEIGLHGFAVARGADEALLRSGARVAETVWRRRAPQAASNSCCSTASP
ncbi:hypothetical protein [Lysobacter humi (ex Lee et al. 2017)]